LGKPFEKELEKIPCTIKWAFSEKINSIFEEIIETITQFPLLVVGSGGSLSAAHFVARLNEQKSGKLARAITPLELIFSPINPSIHAVLFLTASGNNKDIIKAFEYAIHREFAAIAIVCAKVGSKIVKKASDFSYVQVYEYLNPTGKDGFLAVNSLLSINILAARAFNAIDTSNNNIQKLIDFKHNLQKSNWDKILSRKTLIALGAEWAWPALVDLESKFTEAALGNVLITDFRNFGHGRHHWFDKKGDESALLVLETPQVTSLALKTTTILPAKFPRAVVKSLFSGPLACIDLLIQIFYLVNEAGRRASIDPGKPRVPEYGRKLYHINLPVASTSRAKNRIAWIERKARVSEYSHSVLGKRLDQFLSDLKNIQFAGIVFDYDGTLCDSPERFTKPKPEIAEALNNLLSSGIAFGVATGRGKSVQESLRLVINRKFWNRIIVGNYNGSTVLQLNKDLPRFNGNLSKNIKEVKERLSQDALLMENTNITVRAKQISFVPKSSFSKQNVFARVCEILRDLRNIHIVQSDHSVDILDKEASKIHVVEELRGRLKDKARNILIIGDQGQYGGNDFEMLSLPYSLSVNNISSSLTTCWNLSPCGLRGMMATISIIKAINIENKLFRLDVDCLDKEKCI
jgi:HAD superfamily hydrolase (TIGR01484 family)